MLCYWKTLHVVLLLVKKARSWLDHTFHILDHTFILTRAADWSHLAAKYHSILKEGEYEYVYRIERLPFCTMIKCLRCMMYSSYV